MIKIKIRNNNEILENEVLENEVLENDSNKEKKTNKIMKSYKKVIMKIMKLFIRGVLIVVPIYLIIAWIFFMPHYQKEIVKNILPFNKVSQEVELIDTIDKTKVVKLPSKKARNLTAFLEEYGFFETFQENPNYSNLLHVLNEIKLVTESEQNTLDNLIASYYEAYIKNKLFEESSIESSNSEEIIKEIE